MIQEFSVSNFYSIREDITINFLPSSDEKMLDYYTAEAAPGVRLLKLGIIYGANASGKTTVLRALSFFRSLMVTRPLDKMAALGYTPFMLDEGSRDRRSYMEMTFFIDGKKYVLGCEFDRGKVYFEQLVVYATSRPSLLYRREYSQQTGHSTITFGGKAGLSKKSRLAIEGNTINNCTAMAAFGQSNVETTCLDKVYEYFSRRMLDLLYPGMPVMQYVRSQLQGDADNQLKSFLLKLLKASDFNIVDFVVDKSDEGRDTLIFKHVGDSGAFNLGEENESAGTQRFMAMSLILHQLINGDCFLSIDEVETSIHYELFSYFIKVFLANSEGTSQMFLSTHDINLLDEDFIRRDVIWFTEKDTKGATSLKRLSVSGLHRTMSVYNAYRQGKLVELPFLGSIFLDLD